MASTKTQSAKSAPTKDGKAPGGYFQVPIKGIFMSVPGIMGYSHLLKPDEYQGKKSFKVALHMTPEATAAFVKYVEEKIVEPYKEALLDVVPKDKKGQSTRILKEQSVEEWLNEKLKQPSESARIQLPYLEFKLNYSYENKKGETITNAVKAWDVQKALLDLVNLRLAMGSVIKVGFQAKLWAGVLNKYHIEPSFKLVGVQVLKAEHYGAGGAKITEDVTDEDLALLEQGFELEDLSEYAVADGKPKGSQSQEPEEAGDLDDEIPF